MALHHRLIGKVAQLYWRVRKPRTLGVRAIVLDRDQRIALVQHTYIDGWYLPGGGVKKGESFKAAILRELREEIAIAVSRVERVLGIYHSRREAKDDHIVIFVVRIDDASTGKLQNGDLMEIEQAAWFPINDLPRGVSPATSRRIAEYEAGTFGLGDW